MVSMSSMSSMHRNVRNEIVNEGLKELLDEVMEEVMKEICQHCKYWGLCKCHLNPIPVQKQANDTCGQFKPRMLTEDIK